MKCLQDSVTPHVMTQQQPYAHAAFEGIYFCQASLAPYNSIFVKRIGQMYWIGQDCRGDQFNSLVKELFTHPKLNDSL